MTLDRTPLTQGGLIKGATLLLTIICAVAAVVWQLSAVREELAGLRSEMTHMMRATTSASDERREAERAIHALDKRVTALEVGR